MPLLENLFSQATVERLGWMLVHCLWQATAVALLLAGTLRLLRWTEASLRYVVSCAALGLMVVSPAITIQFISSVAPLTEQPLLPAIGPSVALASPLSTQAVSEISPGAEPLPILEMAASSAPVSWRQRVVSALRPALPYVVLGWLLGVVGLSAWHLGGWAQLQRIKHRMVRQVGSALRDRVEELGARLGVYRAVALLESALVEVPTVVGWVRPAILLPASALTGLGPDQLEAILAHELAHIRRYDYLVNVLQTVVEILGFYRPVVWWVSRRIRIERENCCDDLAVRVCGDSLQYAKALTCMEEIRHGRTEWAVAATGGSLLGRIARLLGRPAVDDRRFTWLPGLITLLLITALLIPAALVLGAARPQQNSATTQDVNNAPKPLEDQQSDSPKVQVRHDVNDANTPSSEKRASVLLEFVIAKVSNDAVLDRETVQQVLNLLGGTVQTDAPPMTAHAFLQKYVTGRELPPEMIHSLMDVLRTRGYVKVESRPQVLARDGEKAKVRIGAEIPVPVPAQGDDSSQAMALEYVEYGTAIQVTAHVQDPNVLTLEMAVELAHVLPNRPQEEVPRIRRRVVESTMTLSTAHYFSLLMEPRLDEDNHAQDEAPMLVMVKPSIVASQSARMTKEDEAPEGPATSGAARRRQVLLDARVVAMERADLLNLGVEWGRPKVLRSFNHDSTGNGNIDSNQMTGIRLGYTSDGEFTASLLAALDLLQENGRADILSNPQILAQDSRQSQLKVATEEYLMMAPPTPGESSPSVWHLQKVETGTTLTFTPRVDDHNNITLEATVELSDSVPYKSSNLPIVTRRVAKNAVTIRNGGTVVMAGLMDSRAGRQDNSTRETAIFVTACLVDEQRSENLPPSEPNEAAIHIPSTNEYLVYSPITIMFTGDNLREALASLSISAGVPIVVDPNVTGRIYADIREQPLEKALEIMLVGTPYVATRMADYYLVSERPTSSPAKPERTETRVIRLNSITAGRAKRLLSPVLAPYVTAEPVDPNHRGCIVTIDAPASLVDRIAADLRRMDRRRRQVLLDARVIAMSRRDLLDLGIEWGVPAPAVGMPAGSVLAPGEKSGNDALKDVLVGCARGRTSKDSLCAKLNLLSETDQAECLSTPQVLAEDGVRCLLKQAPEEWHSNVDLRQPGLIGQPSELQKIAEETSFFITPHIGDNNDITLEMSLQFSHDVAKSQKSDTPPVIRPVKKNAITIEDCGTAVWAGLTKNETKQKKRVSGLGGLPLLGPLFRNNDKDKPPREIVVFVTAHLIRDMPHASATSEAR